MKNLFLKKNVILAFATVLSASIMLSGCSFGKKDLDEGSNKEDGNEIIVSSTEEFLDAIEPGANIVFKRGTYNFTPDLEDLYDGDGSKFNRNHDYVRIEECFDGLQLVIEDVDGLTISGQEGKDIELQVEPRYADVLSFVDCKDITINHMTIGHTIEQGSCAGDVLQFEDCEDITLTDLDLYGCGTYGICAMDTKSINMTNSIIRDCSYGIMDLNDSDAKFKSCTFSGCVGFSMLEICDSEVTFNKCDFMNNDTSNDTFVTYYNVGSGFVNFKSCSFGEMESYSISNNSSYYAGSNITFDSNCTFADGYSGMPDADAGNGADDGNTAANDYVFDGIIDTPYEILEAIGPYAEVSIEPGYYNLTDFINTIDVDEWNREHDNVKIYEVYDGYSVRVENSYGLYIHSSTYNHDDVEIVVDPRYADVMEFYQCMNLQLEGLTMGHTNKGDCSGSVVGLDGCEYVLLTDMDLYGCGVYGVESFASGYISVWHSYIHDCEYGPFDLMSLTGFVDFMDCELTYSDGCGYIAPSRYDTTFTDCTFGFNESNIYYNPFVTFDNCTFYSEAIAPENGIGGHEDIGEVSELTISEYCDTYYQNGDVFYSAFELVNSEGSSLLPLYVGGEGEDFAYLYSVLAILDDGTGYIKGLNQDEKIEFTWSVSADDSFMILTLDEESQWFEGETELDLYFYADPYGYNTYTQLKSENMSIWYLNM